MTDVDTAALRALADAAEQEGREEAERIAEYRRRKWFEPRWDWQYVTHRSALAEALRDPATVRALCDGYDEAQRLRGAAPSVTQYTRDGVAEEDGAEVPAFAWIKADDVREAFARLADANAARQALAGLVADLREMADEWREAWSSVALDDNELDVLRQIALAWLSARGCVGAVIDRHAPATPTTED